MIRAEPLRAFAERFAARRASIRRAFVASYGMAEATLALTIGAARHRACAADVRSTSTGWSATSVAVRRRAAGSRRTREFALCGRPLPGHELEVRGEDGEVAGGPPRRPHLRPRARA